MQLVNDNEIFINLSSLIHQVPKLTQKDKAVKAGVKVLTKPGCFYSPH
jgi:hypothetical protein